MRNRDVIETIEENVKLLREKEARINRIEQFYVLFGDLTL